MGTSHTPLPYRRRDWGSGFTQSLFKKRDNNSSNTNNKHSVAHSATCQQERPRSLHMTLVGYLGQASTTLPPWSLAFLVNCGQS